MTFSKHFGWMDVLDNKDVDQSGGDDSAEAINERLAAMHAENPGTYGPLGGSGSEESGPSGRLVSGGGTLVIPPGNYRCGESVFGYPGQEIIVSSGARLFADEDFADMSVVDNFAPTSLGGFGAPSFTVSGRGTIDGNGAAPHGIRTRVASHGKVTGLTVHNCTSHGVVLGNSQYSHLEQVQSYGNGGYGFFFGRDPDVNASFGCDSLTTVGLLSLGNGLGGMRIEEAAGGTHIGFNPSNEGTGPGVSIQPIAGLVNGQTFIGGKFEGCLYGWEVLAREGSNALPRGTAFINCYHVLQPPGGTGTGAGANPTYRFGINEGIHTSVVGGGSSFNNAADWPGLGWPSDGPGSPTTEGGFSFAMYQQHSRLGSLHLQDVATMRGSITLPYACDEVGNLWPEDHTPTNTNFAVSAIGRDDTVLPNPDGSAAFPSGGYFGPNRPNV